jgi:hypothetical protein
MNRFKIVATSLALIAVLVVSAAYAKSPRKSDPPCTIAPTAVVVGQTYVVSASGIPTDTAINLWVTDPSGITSGSPLGSTPDGSFNLNESSPSPGTWTYAFSGPTKQQNTTVYSTCSVSAS